jgi:DNA-binding NarL/FixJ family response regulator
MDVTANPAPWTGTPGGRAVPRGIRNIATNSGLTGRESQIAALAAKGRTNHKIADRLFITASTIEYVAQSHNWRSVTSV